MAKVKPKSLKNKRNPTYATKTPYECEGCKCLKCDFEGECHCMLKDPYLKASIKREGIKSGEGFSICDNYMGVQ